VRFSVLIPVHNEAAFLGRCLASVQKAAEPFPGEVETVVCLNRCTDESEAIARAAGARIITEDAKCLSTIRNAAARAACGEILVTLDADSVMSANLLVMVDRKLQAERVVGGGVWISADRISLGIAVTGFLILLYLLWHRISCGSFWCRRADFLAIGGFDETMLSAEDLDFAIRLKRFGRSRGQKFVTLYRAHIVTSSRKFDHFGDWYFLHNLPQTLKLLGGRDRHGADKFWYDWKKNAGRRAGP
jgi:glycosyltransferase involved in cell wall biosynthesis